MPNTLAHIGINGLFTKAVFKKSDLLWIYLGCVIPDFPWIVRKLISIGFPNINGYDLHTYVIVQASLLFSLIVCASFAILSINFIKTFIILSVGSILHLLLDLIQIKWANGVHLFAPFNWELINYGLFWPESFGTYSITFIGIIFFIYNWKNIKNSNPQLLLSQKRIILFLILMLVYFFLPLLFMIDVKNENNHFISTLQNYDGRTSNYVEMDRKKVSYNNETASYWIESFNRDKIELQNVDKISESKISIKGVFLTNDLIRVDEIHENWAVFRDGASYVGLVLVLIAWIINIKSKKI